jgi:transposase
MERIPNRRYTKEFREETVKLVKEGGLSVPETARRLSLPKTTLENWIRISKTHHELNSADDDKHLEEFLLEMLMGMGFSHVVLYTYADCEYRR